MMAPWEIWGAQIDGDTVELMLVVSSDFHLRANLGRVVTVLPVTDAFRDLDYRVPIEHPSDGTDHWVVTDQLRTIAAVMHPTGWKLTDDEISAVKHALKHMVAFA